MNTPTLLSASDAAAETLQPADGIDILLVEVSGHVFGVEALSVRMITEFSLFDSNVIIESLLGSMRLADTKIPLLSIAEFFGLPQTSREAKMEAVIVATEHNELFSFIISRVVDTISVDSFYKIPHEALLYSDIYKSAFAYKQTYSLLLNPTGIFHHVIERVREQGAL